MQGIASQTQLAEGAIQQQGQEHLQQHFQQQQPPPLQQQEHHQQHSRCTLDQMVQMVQEYDCWVFDCDGEARPRLQQLQPVDPASLQHSSAASSHTYIMTTLTLLHQLACQTPITVRASWQLTTPVAIQQVLLSAWSTIRHAPCRLWCGTNTATASAQLQTHNTSPALG